MQRIIMHLDFNSYFASCEQQENISWRGRPLGVCEHLGGIIIAPSIEAKRWGVKTAMPVWEAKKLCPQIILTPTHPNIYRLYTARFLKLLSEYTETIEKYSIDEAFIDLTKACNIRRPSRHSEPNAPEAKNLDPSPSALLRMTERPWEQVDPFVEAERIAREIKQRITKEVGDYLTCSVGIGWNKLVAKIGSDMQKPNGLVVIRPEDKHQLYKKLQLTDIPGIAKRQEKNLNALGIRTLNDLRDYPISKLVAHFGIMGYHLHRIGQLEGSWKEEFKHSDPMKSIGHVYTIAREHRNSTVAEPVLYKLCEMVGVRLRANKFVGNIVHVHIWDGEEYVGKGKKLSYFLDDGRDIFLECKNILKNIFSVGNAKSWKYPVIVKQVGVTVSGLMPAQHQLSLFAFDEKKRRLVSAMDKINQKYEDLSLSLRGGVQPTTKQSQRLDDGIASDALAMTQKRATSNLGDNHEGVDRGFTIARVPVHLARSIIRDSIGFGRMKEFSIAKQGIKKPRP